MKYRVLSILMAISIVSIVNASVPIVIPSGQQLYFELYPGSSYSPASGYAIIYSPTNSEYGGWGGCTEPGGDVVIPDTITYNGLKYVVTQIGPGAFLECDAITSIVVPNTVSIIGNNAFWGCTNLVTLNIGEGVKRMATFQSYDWNTSGIVANCPSLDTIYFNADSCFTGFLFGFDHGDNIGQHTTVIIGNNVRYINNNMFNKHNMSRSIESVVVGNSVTTIGNNAFLNCEDLSTITFLSQNPPMLGSDVFYGVSTDSILCYIPCGRTSVYYNQWSALFNYIEASTSYTLSVSSNYNSWGIAEVIQQPSCNGDAIIGATASCGYYFVRWSDGNTDNPRTLTLQNDTYLTAFFASSYNVPDTLFVHDTTTVNNYIHDTTYLPIYLHDTVPMIEYLHDTIYLPQYIHDTTIVNHYFHDTTYITQTDTVTNTVYDTITNTIYDTSVVYRTDTLWLHDTMLVHDTVYIHDTIVVGMDEVDAINAKIYTSNGQIVVDGAESNTVWLYDVNGRVLATKQDELAPLRFDVPASGAYMVKIGDHPTRKVVVVR